MLASAISKGIVAAEGAMLGVEREITKDASVLIEICEGVVGAVVKPIVLVMLGHLLGIDVPEEALREGLKGDSGGVVGRAIVDTVWAAMQPESPNIVPGDENARKFMAMIANMHINSWYEGLLAEETINASVFLKAAESISELGKDLINSLGLSRLMRVALKPLVDETIATPLRWKVNTLYMPSRLNASTIVRQIARGRWPREKGVSDIAQQGYSPDRIEALLNEAARFMSLEESMLLVRRGAWTEDQVIEDLKHQGWEEPVAQLIIHAYKEKRLLSIRDDIISAARTAYAARDIDESAFRKIIREVVTDADEFQEQLIVGGTLRELKKNHLSHIEIKDAVKAHILTFRDYRQWLDDQRFSPDDQLTLELLLHYDINKTADLEKERAAIVKARAQAAAEKRAAAEQKRADIEAQRALHRRGSLADLNRAAVRGLIDFSRVEEVLNADYDPDTVAILVGLLEDDRQRYLAQQQAAADAKQRAAVRNVDVGALETSVLEGVLSVDEFRARLAFLKFSPDDADLLTATLQAKIDDRARAQQKRDEAAARAKLKTIDLARVELLVRRGVRPMADYEALLTSLGYDAGSVAAMVELLQLHITDDAAARAAREAAAEKAATHALTEQELHRGVLLGTATVDDYQQFLIDNHYTKAAIAALVDVVTQELANAAAVQAAKDAAAAARATKHLTLEQVRRGVLLGERTIDDFQKFLVDNGWTADAQVLLVNELRDDVDAADAARRKRESAGTAVGSPRLPLSQRARAARLGLIPPDVYQQELVDFGYTPDDVALEMDLLTTEIAAIQEARAKRDALAADAAARRQAAADAAAARQDAQAIPPGPRELTLDQIRAAVLKGVATIDEYKARAFQLGYAPEDVQTLVDVLGQELAGQVDATARRADVAAKLKADGVTLDELDAAVRAGQSTLATYRFNLEQVGVEPIDAALLAGLLSNELDTAPAAA